MTTLTPLEQAERCLARIAGNLMEDRGALRGLPRLLLFRHAANSLRVGGYPRFAAEVDAAIGKRGQPELDILYRVRGLIARRTAMGRAA